MISFIVISQACLVLLIKGVPTWIAILLSICYGICNCVSLVLWEETKDRIKRIENGISKMKGKKAYFTPEEVRNMTSSEVRENYSKIMASMKAWD